MTVDAFLESLRQDSPPPDLPPALVALWHDGRGAWTDAHDAVQNVNTPDGAWIHAYLHRKEDDIANAHYWYSRAGRTPATGPLEAEWRAIVEELLTRR